MRLLAGDFAEGDRIDVDAGADGLSFAKQPAGASVAPGDQGDQTWHR